MTDAQKIMPGNLLASRRHTTILLLILAAVSLAAAIQARRPPTALAVQLSRLPIYAVLIGIQWLWVRYVQIGMKARGRAVSEFVELRQGRWILSVRDVAYAVLALFFFELIQMGAKHLGGTHARNDFLLPHGVTESTVWVLLSLTAGFCEEVVFRGYLQRQFAAIIGSVAGGIGLQAIIFGVSHGYQGWRVMVVATAFGVIFGLLAWWRGNIRAGIMAHAITDIVAGLRLL